VQSPQNGAFNYADTVCAVGMYAIGINCANSINYVISIKHLTALINTTFIVYT